MRITENDQGFAFDIYKGTDGTPVVHVETPESWDTPHGPKCRIYINDFCIYENPPHRSRKTKDEKSK